MQKGTKIRYHLTQINIITLEKTQKITTVFEDEEKFKHLCTVAKFIKCSNHYRKHTADPQKIETRTTIRPSHPNTRYISKIIESKYLKRHLQTHVHSSTISNSEEAETTQMLIFR